MKKLLFVTIGLIIYFNSKCQDINNDTSFDERYFQSVKTIIDIKISEIEKRNCSATGKRCLYEVVKSGTKTIGYNILGYKYSISTHYWHNTEDGPCPETILTPSFVDTTGKIILENQIVINIVYDSIIIACKPIFNKIDNECKDEEISYSYTSLNGYNINKIDYKLFSIPSNYNNNYVNNIYPIEDSLNLTKSTLFMIVCSDDSDRTTNVFYNNKEEQISKSKMYVAEVVEENNKTTNSPLINTPADGVHRAGLINIRGRMLFEPKYINFKVLKFDTKNKNFILSIVDWNDKFGYTFGIGNTNGEFIFNPVFSEMPYNINEFKPFGKIRYNGNCGLIDENFKFIVEPVYTDIEVINSYYAIVSYSEKIYYEYEKKKNFFDLRTMKKCQDKFSDIILLGGDKFVFEKNRKKGIGSFNPQGIKIILPAKYDQFLFLSDDFIYCSTSTIIGNPKLLYPKINRNYYFITGTGEIISTLDNSVVNNIRTFGGYSEGLINFSTKNGSWGYLNKEGHIVITPQFENASVFVNGKARVLKYGTEYFINKKGERMF